MVRLKLTYAVLFILVLFETCINFSVHFPVLFPHLSLIVLIYVALHDGARVGIKCGLWLGFLLDLLSIYRFGVFTGLYFVVGGMCGLLRGKVFTEAFISQWTIPAAAYVFVLSSVLWVVDPSASLDYTYVAARILKQTSLISTLLVSPIMFLFCRKFLRRPKQVSNYIFLK